MQLNKSGMRTGYSLTELLLSLVALSLLMMLGLEFFNRHDRAQLAENTAHQLTMQISLAREEAILHKQTLALMLQNHSYQFYVKNTVNNVAWLPLQNDQFLDHTSLPQGIVVQMHSEGSPTTTRTNQSLLNQLTSITIPATTTTSTSSTIPVQSSASSTTTANNMQPAIIFYPQGNITPFSIDVGMNNLIPNYQIIGTSAGEIDLKVYSENFMGLPMK
jgi:Tfp pilus assembly protein FimT